ncbi:MAG: hypothetical protein RIQ89_970 [Bacteroidota bacterium]
MKLRAFVYLLFYLNIAIGHELLAQEWHGIVHSNYAGNLGLYLNPSQAVGSPFKSEWNLIAGDFFFDNNYLYARNFASLIGTTPTNANGESEKKFLDYYSPGLQYGYINNYIIGPGYLSNNKNRILGIQLAWRNTASVNNIPHHVAKAFYSKFDYRPQHGTFYKDSRFNFAAYSALQLNLSYGHVYKENLDHWMSWAITLKPMIATSGGYGDISVGDYVVPDSSTLIVNNADLDYAHAAPDNPDNFAGSFFAIRGVGFGLDAGITYIRDRRRVAYDCDKTADKRKKYKYKMGLSLIDLGYLYFFNDAERLRVNNAGFNWPLIDTIEFRSFSYIDGQISNRFFGNSTQSKYGDRFGMHLPATASIQFDYCIAAQFYINLSIQQRLAYSRKQVWHSNNIALVPRWERRSIEIAIPIMLHEYNNMAVGAAIRLGPLVLGTDRLLSFTGGEVNAFDFFFGIKLNSCFFAGSKYNTGECPY